MRDTMLPDDSMTERRCQWASITQDSSDLGALQKETRNKHMWIQQGFFETIKVTLENGSKV